MPIVLNRSVILRTVAVLRMVEEQAEEPLTKREARQLAETWEAQLDQSQVVVTDRT